MKAIRFSSMWASLVKRWCLDPERIMQHWEYYRLITYALAHQSTSHLLSNLVVGIIFTINFVRSFGILPCITLCFIATVINGLVVMLIYKKHNDTLCGLSGTICALIGGVLVSHHLYFLLVCYAGLGAWATLFFPRRAISHECHFFGVIIGIAYSVLFNTFNS